MLDYWRYFSRNHTEGVASLLPLFNKMKILETIQNILVVATAILLAYLVVDVLSFIVPLLTLQMVAWILLVFIAVEVVGILAYYVFVLSQA